MDVKYLYVIDYFRIHWLRREMYHFQNLC